MNHEHKVVPRWTVYGLLVSYVTVIFMAIGVGWYATTINRKSDERWCELLTPLNSAYTTEVPMTDLGKAVAKAIKNLHSDFC